MSKKITALLLCLVLSCCSQIHQNQFSGDFAQHPSQWSKDDCFSIISCFTVHNMFETSANVRIEVTPCYPLIINAINRLEQIKDDWSDNQFRLHVGTQARDCLGMTVDWKTTEFIDAKGIKYQSVLQLDSLIFLCTISNKNHPISIPSISDLEEQITLENENGQFIKPMFVKGRKENQLIQEENVNIMFKLRDGVNHFLEGSKNMYLVFRGFGDDVRLQIPLADNK
jgi:hypothetical protein